LRQIFVCPGAAGKGTEPHTDVLNKGFLIKVSFKRLAGAKSAPPQARHAFLVPAGDGRDGGPWGLPAMPDQIQDNSSKKQTAKIYICYVQHFKFFR